MDPAPDKPVKFSCYGVRNQSGSEEPKSLMGAAKLLQKPVQIKVVCHWCDQLQGKKTAQMLLRLKRGGETVVDHDLFGIFQRGEDLKYIHFAELKDEDVVTKAEAGDEYEILTITGEDDKYKEQDDVEGFIEYKAELRVFMLNMQVNFKMDDQEQVPEGNTVKA